MALRETSEPVTERAPGAVRRAVISENDWLKRALQVENVGVMFWDLASGALIDANEAFLKLLGYTRADLQKGNLTWQKLTPREYLAISREELKNFAKTGRVGPYEKEYLHKNGTRRWFIFAGSALGDGTLVEFCVDLTAQKAVESALKQSQRLAALGSWEWDISAGRHTWSEETYRIYDREPGSPAASYEELKECFTPESWERLSAAMRKTLAAGASCACDVELVGADRSPRWVTVRGHALRDAAGKVLKVYGTVQDITERKRFEQHIAQLSRAQAILAAVNHAIVHVQEEQALLNEICRVAVEQGGFKLAWVGMVSPDGLVRPVAQAGATEFLKGIRVTIREEPEGRGPVGTAIRENRPVIIEDVRNDPRMRPWMERAQRFGLRYVAAFPIQLGEKVIGGFQVYAPRPGFFDETEIRLLSRLSDDISFALNAIHAIAERKRADEELRKSEQELADFFAASPLGLLWVAPDGRVLRVNRAQLELLGLRSEEILARPIAELHVHSQVAVDVLERVARKETVQNVRALVRHKSGTAKYVLIDANGFWEKGRLAHSRWFVRDITDRVELEREILTISEREQRRLGHDLHDDLCQQLAGIQFLCQTLASELAGKKAAEFAQAADIAEAVKQAMSQTRDLARGLSPVGIEADGLMEGLRQLAARTSKVFRLECLFRCVVPVLVADHAVAIHLYRIAQEAVGNAVKHGKATTITIGLAAAGETLRLRVADNGVGMPRRMKKPEGMGLRIMRYRAGVIDGSLVVQRNRTRGTTVLCSVTGAERATRKRRPR